MKLSESVSLSVSKNGRATYHRTTLLLLNERLSMRKL